MTVKELIAALAALPADMPVRVDDSEYGCHDVERAEVTREYTRFDNDTFKPVYEGPSYVELITL